MAKILKGTPVAESLTEKCKSKCEDLVASGITPCLGILRVGERPDDTSYEKSAIKRCEKIGIKVKSVVLEEEPNDSKYESNPLSERISREINSLNKDSSVHGVLMFRPLPSSEAEEIAVNLLDPAKDVDGMTPGSLASVFSGKGKGYAPCTAAAVMEILKFYEIDVTGKNVVVIGRSLVIGKPVSMLLQRDNATVTMAHTKTVNLPEITRRADIIVAAAGVANMVGETFVSPGGNQIVIDVGINVEKDGKLVGDVDYEAAEPLVSAITPVPGGVGAVTTAVLANHVIQAAGAAKLP